MAGLLIGYARVSTDEQDLTAQRNALDALGVSADRVYVDHGLTGTKRDRPGLREALAACRAGDMLVVTKLDRLARSLPDARDIADELTRREVRTGRLLRARIALKERFAHPGGADGTLSWQDSGARDCYRQIATIADAARRDPADRSTLSDQDDQTLKQIADQALTAARAL
jgi:hypothetical protein